MMSHVGTCPRVHTSGGNRSHDALGHVRLGLLFLDHPVVHDPFSYPLTMA